MFQVGGAVRDEILGVPSKDIDFTVVLDDVDLYSVNDGAFHRDPFMVMVLKLERMGFKIFLETPEFLTVRAQFPKVGMTHKADMLFKPTGGSQSRSGLTADFVLARKEGTYSDGRRPDLVVPGTLEDDLARRDFTMNAIARDGEGNFIDPFNGRIDIDARVIRAVGDPMDRLMEDALRALRALRFSVTKNFKIERSLREAIQHPDVLESILKNISDERIQIELSKMFRHSTIDSMYRMAEFPVLTRAVFSGKVSLDATLKTRGRK